MVMAAPCVARVPSHLHLGTAGRMGKCSVGGQRQGSHLGSGWLQCRACPKSPARATEASGRDVLLGHVLSYSPCPSQRLLLTPSTQGVLHFHLRCILSRQLVPVVRGVVFPPRFTHK